MTHLRGADQITEPTEVRLRGDVVWNMASLAVAGTCGVAMNAMIARSYDPEILGTFNLVYAVYIVFSQFSVMGIHLSVLKHVAQYSANPATCASVVSSALIACVGTALLATALFWVARTQIGDWMGSAKVVTGLACAAPGLFFFSLNKVLLSALNGLSRMRAFAVFQALRYLFMLCGLMAAVAMSLEGELLALVVSIEEVLLFGGLAAAVLPLLGGSAFKPRGTWIATHLRFGVRGCLSYALLELNTRVDVLILGLFASERTVGIYSFAAILAEGVYQLPIVLRNNYSPLLARLIHEGDFERLRELARRGVRMTYLGMTLVGVVMVLLYPVAAVAVTNKEDFLQGWPVFALLILGVVLGSGYVPFGNILVQGGRPGTHTIMVSLLVLVNVAASFLLVPRFLALGSATAAALAYVLAVPLVKLFSRRALKVSI